ncbi:hypothetical protein B0H14DRAFT_3172699 [Mycena olivaceomarginata]|nr:hypothetical protein B0H14DRAFT_3172699 [Mycena olivaceomarginata]
MYPFWDGFRASLVGDRNILYILPRKTGGFLSMAMDPGVHELARAAYPCHLPTRRGVRRAEINIALIDSTVPTSTYLLTSKDSTAITGAWRDAALALAPAANAMYLLIRETDEDRKISTFSGARTNPLRIRTGITYLFEKPTKIGRYRHFLVQERIRCAFAQLESPTQAEEYVSVLGRRARGKFKVDGWTDGWNASRSYATQRADGVDGKPTKIGRYFLVQERVIRTARRKSPSIRHLPAREGRPSEAQTEPNPNPKLTGRPTTGYEMLDIRTTAGAEIEFLMNSLKLDPLEGGEG